LLTKDSDFSWWLQIYIKKNQIPTNKKEKDSNDIKKPYILAVSAAKDDIYPNFQRSLCPNERWVREGSTRCLRTRTRSTRTRGIRTTGYSLFEKLI